MPETLTDRLTWHPADGPMAVLVLPGGGYASHAPHEAEPVADWLNGLGHHAAVLRYPVHPPATRPRSTPPPTRWRRSGHAPT